MAIARSDTAQNVQTDRHVAQRNISVLKTGTGQFHFAFEIHNAARVARTFGIAVKEGSLAELEPLIPLLGKDFQLPREKGHIHKLGFVKTPCPDRGDFDKAIPCVEGLKLASNEQSGYSLVGSVDQGAALVHIVQQVEGRIIGGLSLLIIHTRGK